MRNLVTLKAQKEILKWSKNGQNWPANILDLPKLAKNDIQVFSWNFRNIFGSVYKAYFGGILEVLVYDS